MGLYSISCPQCGAPYTWFSGSTDQRCDKCRKPMEWYIQEASEGFHEFVTRMSPEELEKHHPELAKSREEAGIWYNVVEKSVYELQCSQVVEITKSLGDTSKYWMDLVTIKNGEIDELRAKIVKLEEKTGEKDET